MLKPNSEMLSKSKTTLSKSKNSRFQFFKDNFSKASNSIKNKVITKKKNGHYYYLLYSLRKCSALITIWKNWITN